MREEILDGGFWKQRSIFNTIKHLMIARLMWLVFRRSCIGSFWLDQQWKNHLLLELVGESAARKLRTSEFQNPDEHLCSIQQTGSVIEYRQEFEGILCPKMHWQTHHSNPNGFGLTVVRQCTYYWTPPLDFDRKIHPHPDTFYHLFCCGFRCKFEEENSHPHFVNIQTVNLLPEIICPFPNLCKSWSLTFTDHKFAHQSLL